MNDLQNTMRFVQEGIFVDDEERLDACTYRLVHMFRTMLNHKVQTGVPFHAAVLELSYINAKQLVINNLRCEYDDIQLNQIDIDIYYNWIIQQAGSKIKGVDFDSMLTANFLTDFFK